MKLHSMEEKVRYYITEEDGRQEKQTQSGLLQREEMSDKNEDNRFRFVNHMIISKDMQDYETYEKLSEEYAYKDYLVKKLFIPELKY